MAHWRCDWQPDDLNPGPECPYCAGDMCARFDGLGCTHDRQERHGYPAASEHLMTGSCWCQPKVSYENPITGDRVYVHRYLADGAA